MSISGDIDGDLANDSVTSYTLDGVPRVHASLASGGQSDTEVVLAANTAITINFEDIDHSAGAATPPPVAVMAVGQGSAGRGEIALFTFLTLTTKYCIQQWVLGDVPTQFPVTRVEGHAGGLMCDGAAGSIHYVLQDAVQQASGEWKVSGAELGHDFTRAELTPLAAETIPNAPDVPTIYGNITGCSHPPFP